MLSLPVMTPLVYHTRCSLSSVFFSTLQLLHQYRPQVLLSLLKPTLGEEDPEKMQQIKAWVSIENL